MNRRQAIGWLAVAAAPFPAMAGSATSHETVDWRLAQLFTDAGRRGAFVAYRVEGRQLILSDRAGCDRPALPASTFKIANSIIALESGVVADPNKDVFKWDGVERPFPNWNRDHTLRSAVAASAVPVFQEIARRIGPERMRRYLVAFDYGNRAIGGGIDRFWLTGDLRISTRQQVMFLDRLRRNALPVSTRSQELARDILPTSTVGDAVIQAKTGLVGVDDRSVAGGWRATAGWLVGFAESGGRRTVFALHLDISDQRDIAVRLPLAQKALALVGAI